MTNLRRWTSRPTRPRHDVAGPSLNVDLFIAEVGGEAGLGGADVAAHGGPMEKEPATWKAAGSWAVDTDKAREACAGPFKWAAGMN